MGRSLAGRGILLALLGLLILAAACPSAGAFVYWDNYYYAIGRSNLDGGGQSPKFVSVSGTPCGVATDGRYVYWADELYGTIGRARIDGVGKPTDSYITGLNEPCGVAVFDHHLYWADDGYYGHPGAIGRADLIGPLDVRRNFVPDTLVAPGAYHQFCGVAVDGSGIYWADPDQNEIVRANLGGTGTTPLVQGANGPCGVTLVGGRIFWANGGSGTLGVASITGTAANESYITDQNQPCGVTSYAGYLYWTTSTGQVDGGSVNKVSLSSSSPTADAETIAMGMTDPCGVAVDGLFAGAMKVLSVRTAARQVTIRLTVSASGRVRSAQTSRGVTLIHSGERGTGHAGTVVLHLRLTAAARRSTRKHHTERINLRVTFQPRGGIPTTKELRVAIR